MTGEVKEYKVLLLTDGIFPFVMGGMQKHSYYLAKYLTLSGVDVELAHCTKNIELTEEINNKAFDSFNKNKLKIKHFTFPKLDRFPGHYIRESIQYSKNVFSYYKNRLNEFDFIYAQGFTGYSFLKNTENIPVFTNFHGFEMFQKAPSFKVKLEHLMLRRTVVEILNKSDYIYSFGGQITSILNKLNISTNKIIESPIGIENDWLNENELIVNSPRKFIFIGRYERRKGIEELNKAISLLPKDDCEFHFIGPIDDSKQIHQPNVVYHGSISDPEKIKKLLKSADALLCPSYSEGMPTVIMEAMASGLAIIATDVGAISKQVKDNGIILKSSNPTDIKNGIETFLKLNENEVLEMKKLSLQKVNNEFLWSKVINHNLNEISKKLK